MHRFSAIIVAFLFFQTILAQNPAERVNVFLGTVGDHGQHYYSYHEINGILSFR